MNIRLLTKEDIDVRIAQVQQSWDGSKVEATVLLYKDARVDMRILDEAFGPMNWKREHKMIGDRLYCIVSIYDAEKGEWISKEDVGTESNTEAEKGQASDSFKRACFNWGIGRELYSAPRTKIELNSKEYKDDHGRIKATGLASFSVGHIAYDADRNISELVIVDRFGNARFTMGAQPQQQPQPAPVENNVVQQRRAAKRRPTKPMCEFTLPEGIDTKTFNIMCQRQAAGTPAKSGQSYRNEYAERFAATEQQLKWFDYNVKLIIYNAEQNNQVNA